MTRLRNFQFSKEVSDLLSSEHQPKNAFFAVGSVLNINRTQRFALDFVFET